MKSSNASILIAVGLALSSAALPGNSKPLLLTHMVTTSHISDFCTSFLVYLGTLIPLWHKDPEASEYGPVIPRSVRFVGKGESVLIFGLQTGTMYMCTFCYVLYFNTLTLSPGHYLMHATVRKPH